MASLDLLDDCIVLRLSPWERFMTLHGDLVVPNAALRGVEVLDEPMRKLPRWRSLGTAVPGVLAYGTFRQRGRKEFVAVRGRRRAVRLHLAEHPFTAVVVSVEDPDGLAARMSAVVP